MVATLKRAIFREPRAGNMSGWLGFVVAGGGVFFGCLMIANGLFFSDFSSIGGPSYSPMLVVLGSMSTLQFAAELLPKGCTVLAGLLRVNAVAVALVSLLLILIL